MKLTEHEIESAVVGTVRTVKDERGIGFRRFSENQEAIFRKEHELFPEPYFNTGRPGYFAVNCRGGAGILLDFLTDADAVEILRGGYDTLNDAGAHWQSDLLVDGRLVRSFDEERVRVSFREKKERRVQLFLPHLRADYLSEIDLPGATKFRPYYDALGIDILIFGDSITHGVGASHPSRTMATVLARRLNARVLNQGNSGYVYDPTVIDRVCEPELIVLAYGVNDRGRKTPERLFADTAAFSKRVRELWGDTPAVGILPLYCSLESDPAYAEKARLCDDLLRNAYESAGIAVIDGRELLPHDPAYFTDGVHPNEKGYRIYGDRLAKRLVASGLYPLKK